MKHHFAIALVLLAAPLNSALAIDFKAPILQLDGTPVTISPTDQGRLTLQRVCEDALIANNLPGDSADPKEKGRRFWIAQKIHDGKELTAEEVTMTLKIIGLAYGPLIIGRATEMLDPAAVPK